MKDLANIYLNTLVPMVVEQTNRGERAYDIYSRPMSKTKAADELDPTDEELIWATPIARAAIRKETGIPTWEPKLLNGSHYFGQRMRALIRQRRRTSG